MRHLLGRLGRITGRQLRYSIGAAIHPPTRSLENADDQDGRNHAALLAVRPTDSAPERVSQATVIAIAQALLDVRSLRKGLVKMRFQLSLRCWLSRHEDFVRSAAGRLYLECMECGRQTKGWRTGKSREAREGRSIEGACGTVNCRRYPSTPSNATT